MLSVAVLFFAFTSTNGARLPYEGAHLRPGSPAFQDLVYEPMFSLEDSPAGDQNPEIRFDLEFFSEEPFTEVLSFVVTHRDQVIDYAHELVYTYFACEDSWEHLPDLLRAPVRFNNTGYAHINGSFAVEKSGLYTSFFVNCGKSLLVSGEISYRNPYGFLPGHKYAYMSFYLWMSVVYIILTVVWVTLCLRFRTELFLYHHFISVALWCSLMEMLLNCFEVHHFNVTGERSYWMYAIARIALVYRKTFSRLVIIIVSSGVGIATSKLKRSSCASLGFLGLLYFCVHCAMDLRKLTHFQTTEISDHWVLAFELALLCIDSVFYIWVFSALSATLEELKTHESFKLDVYNKFSVVLIASLISATVFNLYDVHYRREVAWETPTGWASYWFVEEGYWMMSTTFLLAVVMFLWRPSENSSKYALHTQIPSNEPDSHQSHSSDDESHCSVSSEESHKDLLKNQTNKLAPFRSSDVPDDDSGLDINIELDALVESQGYRPVVQLTVPTGSTPPKNSPRFVIDEFDESDCSIDGESKSTLP